MKQISLFIPLLGTLLLSGCAGTNTEFECNATTSDTCMTMEQANEKAKKLEQSSEAKPVAASLPRLAEGNFRTMPVAGLVMTVLTVGLVSCAGKSLPRFWPGDFFPVFYACHLAVLGVLAL
ncbi:type IV conjugative transfer system lipoprotein TraV [Klebsiella pneumoniae]|uniref:type IV conjugative transfer system lipoprotein TraV n=1 Tax=Klebsiella pneumoniae TaxID=573 RepID=UPI003F5CC561